MSTVEANFLYTVLPTEAMTFALANIRKVYGIRQLKFDSATHTLCVEYDSTRLNAAAVGKLVRQSGLKVTPLRSQQPDQQTERAA